MPGLPQPQAVPLIFEGLDTFTDPKRGIATKLDLLENCYVSTPLKLQKRPGFTSQSRSLDGGGSVATGAKLAQYRSELVMCDGLHLYTRNAISGLLAKRGKLTSGSLKVDRVTGDTLATDRINVTGCYSGGVTLIAWQVKATSNHVTTWHLIDNATGALLNGGTISMFMPKAVTCGGFLFLFGVTSPATDLVVRKVDPAAPTVMGSPTTVATAIGNTYDVTADTATPQLLVAYHTTVDQIAIKAVTTVSMTVAGPTTLVHAGGSVASVLAWLYHDYSNGSAYLAATWSAVGIGTFVYDINTTTRASSSPTSVDTTSTAANVFALNGYYNTTSTNRTVFIERSGATVDLNFIKGWTQGTGFELARGLTMGSRIWRQNTRYYMAVSYEDTVQRHRMLLEYEHATNGASGGTAIVGYLAAKDDGGISPGAGSSTPSPTDLSPPIDYGNGVYGLPWHYSFNLGSTYGVVNHRLTFGEAGLGTPTQFADALFVPGFQLHAYDGSQVVEQGFYMRPPAPTLGSVAGGSKAGGGTYLVKLVYRWTDAKGRTWRSQPSSATSITLAGNQTVRVTAKTCRVTNKDPKFNLTGSISKVTIEAYCTINGGPTYYYDATGTNDVTADTITIDLSQSDATLQAQQLLYNQGGVLNNETPPGVRLVRAFGNRLFVCSGDGDIWHTKAITSGEGAHFSSTFRIPLDTSAGRITALMDMDQSFFMGQETAIYVLGGGNPGDTGTNLFGEPTRVNTTIGPSDQVSVQRITTGLAFNTTRGIHRMSRGLETQYVGQQVQRFTQADTITGSAVLKNRNHAVWTTSNGDLLVYDFVLGQWFVWTGLAAVAAALYSGLLAILASDGTIKIESAAAFSDDSTAVVMKIRTAWLSLAGFAGYQRLWEVLALGEYKGAHSLKFSISYNMSTHNAESVSANAAVPTYNDGIEASYIWRAAPKQQLCSSVRITVEDVLSGSGSEGFHLSGMAVLVGVVGGTHRISAAKTLA